MGGESFSEIKDEELESSFHQIIKLIVPNLIFLIDEFRSSPKGGAKFNSIVVPSWYSYYQKPFSALLIDVVSATGMLEDIQKIHNSSNPFGEILNLAYPPIPYVGKKIPDVVTGKQVSAIFALIKNFESILYNKRTINALLNDVATGNDLDGSIIKKILEVDRTAIHTYAIKFKLKEAEITCNRKLINNISNSLYFSKEKKSKVKYPKLTFAIYLLLDFNAFDSMSEVEREGLLLKYYDKHKELNSFHRECNRIRRSLETQKVSKRVGENRNK